MRICAYQPDIAANLGATIRLCACFGLDLDVIEPCGFPLSTKILRRTAMDYADITRVHRYLSWETYLAGRESGRDAGRLILLTTKADTELWDFSFQSNDVLVLGRESAGVPDSVHDICDGRVKLPMTPPARSLNVVVCAGIALGEALRQTRA